MRNWLEQRLDDAPASLRARIVESVTSGTAPRSPLLLAEQLKAIAEDLMVEAQSGPPNHDTAMTLLVADALITHACEVVAKETPENLGDI